MGYKYKSAKQHANVQKTQKNYPLVKRIGMTISDILKIMSLAHIEITR